MFISMLVDQSYKETIRTMLSDHLIELWDQSKIIGTYDGAGNPEYPLFDDYFTDIDHRYPFIFLINSEVAGFCLLQHTDDQPFEITEYYLKPPYRNQGYGREAFDKIKAFCISIEKHPVIQIHCSTEYNNAHVFWQKLGFSQSASDQNNVVYQYKIDKVKRWLE